MVALRILVLSGVVAVISSAAAQPVPPPEGGQPEATEPAPAPAPETPPPIYEPQLLRLSEILGSLYFLRGLCESGDASVWQAEMRALIAAEDPGPTRRSRLIGRFNHGFETFNSVYRTCTPSAELAIAHYLSEGERLSSDVRVRYSQ